MHWHKLGTCATVTYRLYAGEPLTAPDSSGQGGTYPVLVEATENRYDSTSVFLRRARPGDSVSRPELDVVGEFVVSSLEERVHRTVRGSIEKHSDGTTRSFDFFWLANKSDCTPVDDHVSP